MQIGCNKDLVCLSAQVLCQLTGTAKRKKAVWCSSRFFCAHSLCFPRFYFSASQKHASKSFSSYFFLSEHYVFKFFWSFLCFLSSGIPEVQRAMMHMNSWHCGFKSDSWPLSQVSQDSGLSHIKPRWLSSPEKKDSIGFAFKCLGQSMSTFSW